MSQSYLLVNRVLESGTVTRFPLRSTTMLLSVNHLVNADHRSDSIVPQFPSLVKYADASMLADSSTISKLNSIPLCLATSMTILAVS